MNPAKNAAVGISVNCVIFSNFTLKDIALIVSNFFTKKNNQENKDKEKLQQFASILPKTSPTNFAARAQINASSPMALVNTPHSFFSTATTAITAVPMEELQVAENDQPISVKNGCVVLCYRGFYGYHAF